MAGSPPATMRFHDRSSVSLRLSLFALFVGVLLARIVYVSLFVEDLPFWDQWDGEGDRLLRPWVEGSWHLGSLFSPHNEHRIAFTRLLTLVSFSLNNGQWDNLVESYVSAGVYAAMYVLLAALLCRRESSGRVRVSIVLFLMCGVAVLPFGWENLLVGFQSAFYFMTIAAIGMIAVTVYRRASRGTVVLLCLLGVASLFTMASGVLASVTVIGVAILRYWRDRVGARFVLAVIISMALITAAGLALIPNVPGHAELRAVGIVENLKAVLASATWPLQPFGSDKWPNGLRLALAIILWAPSLIWLVRFYRLRTADDSELFAGGTILWVALQAVAIAGGRGHGMVVLPSRYMETPAIGLLANAWFAVRLISLPYNSHSIALVMRAIALAFVSIATWGLAIRTPVDLQEMRSRHELVLLETENVYDYIRTGDFKHLQQPFLGIPYPTPTTCVPC